MEFPPADSFEEILDAISYPQFVEVGYEPPAPKVDDVTRAAQQSVRDLPLDDVPKGGEIAVGLGSRGIYDAPPIAEAVIDEFQTRGYNTIAIPAMGSHGGASAEGQRETLESLGYSSDRLGCSIDARMETEVIGETGQGYPVHIAKTALDKDGIIVLNRVKPHTNFQGEIESGICKMTAIGLGKQPGARAVHSAAIELGYVTAIEETVDVIQETLPFLGGIAIVENSQERAAKIKGIPSAHIPEAETTLLSEARDLMATLPYNELDALIVDEIGKDISGTGMDTNVIGRARVIGGSIASSPRIDRIVVRGLTKETHGNGHGIGLADLTTVDVIEQLDLKAMYTNALTSGSLQRDSLPVALPTDELAIQAALTTAGEYNPDTARIVWIDNTLDLSRFKISALLAEEEYDYITVHDRYELSFEHGKPVLEKLS